MLLNDTFFEVKGLGYRSVSKLPKKSKLFYFDTAILLNVSVMTIKGCNILPLQLLSELNKRLERTNPIPKLSHKNPNTHTLTYQSHKQIQYMYISFFLILIVGMALMPQAFLFPSSFF